MQTDRSEKVLRGIGWMGSASLMQSALRVGLMVILGRLLAPDAFGLIALATAVVSLVEIVTRLDIESALIQRSSLTDEILAVAASYALLTALAGVVLLLALAGPLSDLLGGGPELASLIRLMVLTLPIGALTMAPRALLSRHGQFRYLAMADLAAYALASFVVAIPLALAGTGAWALAWSALAQSFVTMLLLARRQTPFRGLRFDFELMRDLLTFGIPLTGAKIANFVALQADNVIVGRFLGVAALGAYSRAYALSSLPASLFAQAVGSALFPVMSGAQTDQGAIQRAMLRGVVALLAIFPPLSAYCFVYGESIIALLLGPQWDRAVLPFQILSLVMYFRVAYKIPDIVLRSVGRTGLVMRIQILYVLLVVAAAMVGVRHGLVGVALGVGFAILLQYAQAMWQTLRAVGMETSGLLALHLAAIMVGALSYAVLYGFEAYMTRVIAPQVHYVHLLLGALPLMALYALVMSLARTIFGVHGRWWVMRIFSRWYA